MATTTPSRSSCPKVDTQRRGSLTAPSLPPNSSWKRTSAVARYHFSMGSRKACIEDGQNLFPELGLAIHRCQDRGLLPLLLYSLGSKQEQKAEE
mmetsp:Transcript_9313/g.20566  ORF Transcript_9313/g.20566 Transcript_9313/m.20566 type:complete len:94 (-) Transcript_9313:424-705(-)